MVKKSSNDDKSKTQGKDTTTGDEVKKPATATKKSTTGTASRSGTTAAGKSKTTPAKKAGSARKKATASKQPAASAADNTAGKTVTSKTTAGKAPAAKTAAQDKTKAAPSAAEKTAQTRKSVAGTTTKTVPSPTATEATKTESAAGEEIKPPPPRQESGPKGKIVPRSRSEKAGQKKPGVTSKTSPEPVRTSVLAEEKTPDAAEQAGRDTETGGQPTYQEPETPLASPPPPVEAAEAINPPLQEQQQATEEPQDAPGQEQEVQHNAHPGPQHPPMFIVQITPELAPLAKVGGLADVVTGLSRELELRGNSVEIILPKYDNMRYDHIWGLCKTFDDLWVPWYGGNIHCSVWFGFVHGRKCFFIEPHSQDNFFNRGSIYGFDDDILRFTFFSRAALEFLWQSGKHPDIIHCHDWQTALVPVFLYEIYQHMGMTHPRVCFTIHNFKHQGVTGGFLLEATGLHRPEYYFHPDRLLDNHTPNAINLMKGGIVYANFVTTVSPKYAGETKDGGQGFGLEPTLHTHHYKYGGVVNGIDYDVWNPEIDSHIPVHYNVDNIQEKYGNKHALRNRLLLADNEKPIIAFIGRLDPQKGLDLVRHALFYALNNGAQFVLLGSSPEQEINNYFWELKRHLNDSPDCHIEVGFDEDLAHLIYAGADMMVVPSLFEPCGLTQLIAMKYGTIPVVRSVGGLADTVFDKDYAHDKALHERNGYVFQNFDNAGLESALSRAIACYYQYPEHFRDLMRNAMRYDYSWHTAGQHYLNIYDYIRNK